MSFSWSIFDLSMPALAWINPSLCSTINTPILYLTTFCDSFNIAWIKFGSFASFLDNSIASFEGEIFEISKYLSSDFETTFWAIAKTSPSLISIDSFLTESMINWDKLSPGWISGIVSSALRLIDLIIYPVFNVR